MQVLLRERVPKLGNRGDVVNVKNGYARNFLLPKGIAMQVKAGDLKAIKAENARLNKVVAQERLEKTELAEKLKSASVTINAKANEEGHLFGSVGASDIAAALSAEVTPVEEHDVRMEAPIKNLGVYDVAIHVAADLDVAVRVWIVAEEESA